MTAQHLLEWGRTYHYPQLLLNEETGEVLHAGERFWRQLIVHQDRKRIARAKRRVQKWQAYLTKREEKIA